MSYTYPGCDNEFTKGDRMHKAIQNESILQNTIGNYCTTISRVDNVCFGQTRTVSLTNVGSATTIWTSSSNVRITSSTNTSAQIRALYSSSSGNGSITATLDGTTLQQYFRVGSPSSLNNLRITTTGNGNYLFSNIWQELLVFGNGGGEIEWRLSTSVWTRNCGQNCILVYPASPDHTIIHDIITIGIRAKNDCGHSDWYYKNFRVSETNPYSEETTFGEGRPFGGGRPSEGPSPFDGRRNRRH